MNLANLITVFRIAITPVYLFFLYYYFNPGGMSNWILLLLFILLAASDGIDGAVARRKGIVTKLGKLLDPIADKVFLGGTFVTLSLMQIIPWWVTIAILVREIAITLYRLVVIKDRVIPASGSGKSKTVLQCIALGWYISPLPWTFMLTGFDIGYGLLYGAVFLTWFSAIEYIRESR
ncbi:MAG: CDP-diacylglycerol--glycerol-3-phosphate 3-phosphatidyltransferase [Actinomycetota bacterium]|jgi:CDP-diacylglycerol---glycerol-3-phosphate 3-phosphatidyltransferase